MKKKVDHVGEMTQKRFAFEGEIKQALETLNNMVYPEMTIHASTEKAIPLKIMMNAVGLVFMTEVKAGFLFSGKGGSGVVIARLPDGTWSGPSLFGHAGIGAGLMVGASKTNSVILLNTPEAVKTFSGKGQVKLGADVEVAAGPVGRHAGGAANVGANGVAPSYAYSHSQGLYAGISIDGTVLIPRDNDNAKVYGRPVTTEDILTGRVEAPPSMILQDLYALLNKIYQDAKVEKASAAEKASAKAAAQKPLAAGPPTSEPTDLINSAEI